MSYNFYQSKSKYKNKKVVYDGISFDSKKEANRYAELKMLEKCGAIKELQLQKEFVIIPAQYEELSQEEYIKGKGKKTHGRCIERAVKYKADFYYYDCEKMIFVCEDTKGFKTKDYIIKRKLMLYIHGIRIIEI